MRSTLSYMRNLVLTALVCAFVSGIFAQSEIGSATLNGTVTDPSGAAVPGAKVMAKNSATGVERSTTSTAEGLYNFAGLPVGVYELTVEAQGFKKLVRG